MHTADGSELSGRELRLIDRHEVRPGVTIEESIVAGGMIEEDLRECTVELLDDGKLSIAPIDFVPETKRACSLAVASCLSPGFRRFRCPKSA